MSTREAPTGREQKILGIIETARSKRAKFRDTQINMAHGAGGKATQTLIEGLFVPAFEFNMSKFDRSVGHVRRYTVRSLTDAMRAADLTVEQAHYVNIPGLAAWFVGMRLLRMTPKEGGLLSVWDNHVIPRTRRWEAKHRAPFGQSVFAVARVPG